MTTQRASRIDRFDGTEHEFLSNFYPSPVLIRGDSTTLERIECATVEHAFQACKALDVAERRLIAAAPTPGKAKRLGRKAALRPDWDDVRIDVMRALLSQKFGWQNPPLAVRLMATDDAELVEGNTWGDRFWGVADGVGENHLGKLLMERRAKLRAELTEEANRAA